MQRVRFAPAPVQRPRIPVWVGGVLPAARPIARAARGSSGGFDLVVWAEVAAEPGQVPGLARPYQEAGATWWIETARPEPGWWEGITARVAAGP